MNDKIIIKSKNIKSQNTIYKLKMVFNKSVTNIFVFLIFALLLCSFVAGVEVGEEIPVIKGDAITCISESEQIIEELVVDGFNHARIDDLFIQTEVMYETLANKGDKDFSLVVELCENIGAIKAIAYSSRDELGALQKFYNESILPIMDATEIDETIANIEKEINSERYEKVEELVDEAYEQIIDLQAEYSALNVFRSYAVGFFGLIWKQTLIIIAVLLIFYLTFKKRIRRYILNRRLKNLAMRKEILSKLIRKTQGQYFDKGILSEGTYNVRSKKFAELIRDIGRQMPLLTEELARLGGKKSEKSLEINNEKGKIDALKKDKSNLLKKNDSIKPKSKKLKK